MTNSTFPRSHTTIQTVAASAPQHAKSYLLHGSSEDIFSTRSISPAVVPVDSMNIPLLPTQQRKHEK